MPAPIVALCVAAILATAAFARLYRIDLTWYFLDQVRDVQAALGIVTGASFPLVGPLIGWTSGRLGPLYFYLIAPPFAVSGDPLAGSVFVAGLNVLAVFLAYRLARAYFDLPVALCASALFAAFPLAVFSARVLWNPGLVPLFTLVFMRALFAVVVDGRSRSLVVMGAALAALTQIHLTTVAFGLVAAVAFALWRPRVRLAHAAGAVAAFALLYAPYLFYEVTHGFENIRAILRGAATAPAGDAPLALPGLLRSLALLYRPAVDGFVVAEPWPRVPLAVFSLLYRAESALFVAGTAVCVWRLIRDRRLTAPKAVAARQSTGLLLLWLAVPVVFLGTRRTALWWYYLDLLYPVPFVLAAFALTAPAGLSRLTARAQRRCGWAAAGLVIAIGVAQVGFQVGLQRRIDGQGRLVFDVPRFSVTRAGSGLGILPSMPYGYRVRLLRALVEDLGLPADAFARRVHGSVLGSLDENGLLLRRLARHAAGRRAPDSSHFAVTDTGHAAAHPGALAALRFGPYAVFEYRPVVDYASWRCAVAATPAALGASADPGWRPLAVPAAGAGFDLREGRALACEGVLHIPPGVDAVELAVNLLGQAQARSIEAWSGDRRLMPATARSWQSPSLYWAVEAVFALADLRPGDVPFRFAVTGDGLVAGIDVYEHGVRSRAGALPRGELPRVAARTSMAGGGTDAMDAAGEARR